MILNDSEKLFKNIYLKLLYLYLFYFINLIISITLINVYQNLSCFIFNFNLYIDLFLKSLTIIQIIYVYKKRIHNVSYIFLWEYITCISLICYPFFFILVESQKGLDSICWKYNPLFIYFCVFNPIFFFAVFKTGKRRFFVQENNECVICLEDITLLDKVVIDYCGHTFHRYCISTWFEFNNTCPVCRIICSSSNLRTS